MFLTKYIDQTYYKHRKDYQRQNEGHIFSYKSRKLESCSRVCFFNEVFPAPPVSCGAEQNVNSSTERKQKIGNEEVLEIHNIRACSERSYSAKHIESEDTRNRKHQHKKTVYNAWLSSADTEDLANTANDIFKYAEHRWKRGESKEYEEKASPKSA